MGVGGGLEAGEWRSRTERKRRLGNSPARGSGSGASAGAGTAGWGAKPPGEAARDVMRDAWHAAHGLRRTPGAPACGAAQRGC